MDLNLLHVFEAVYREQHLTRAADVLALTPSAVSHALRRLREQLGDALFVRDGKLMRPTPTCQRLAPALLDQLARLRQLIQAWGQFDPALTRQCFRIGMPDPVELMLLTPLHRRLTQLAPLATTASTHFERSSLARVLAAGQLDLAIDVALPLGEPVRHGPLLEDRFCLLMRQDQPSSEAPSLAQYLQARHVAVSSRATGVVMEDGALAHLGWQREVAVRCQNYTTAVRLVADSDLWLTVPERLADEIGQGPAVRRWPLPFSLPPVQLHLYWHAHREGDPANDWLRQQVMALAA
ncbi:LysR family transcriptional regulator [Ideonella sp. B7]|uniref:LysR family transcriptional regulator n=1 Tax=Ideonella benzenivorans TaxID=2831643 RepID=UPI001CEC02B5|nr:LysR family transcriptional regulator [Ideonella benzenivorans]MCA6215795.1 LysR family transcriptional regulator [Ideonella benzenivorans]